MTTEPLPKLDLSILGAQLDVLFENGYDAAVAHNVHLRGLKVPSSYSNGWYEDVIEQRELDGMTADEYSITWHGSDHDRDPLWMSIPIDVLQGSETPEEWADRTYARYLKSEEERKRRDHEKWLATKDKRREQFERLKAEFDDGETASSTTG